jgi:hypothetical protein
MLLKLTSADCRELNFLAAIVILSTLRIRIEAHVPGASTLLAEGSHLSFEWGTTLITSPWNMPTLAHAPLNTTVPWGSSAGAAFFPEPPSWGHAACNFIPSTQAGQLVARITLFGCTTWSEHITCEQHTRP